MGATKVHDQLHKVECITCGKQEMLRYKTYWYRKNKGTGNCKSCISKSQTHTHFKKGAQAWNRGITGKDSHSYGQKRQGLLGADNPFFGKKHSAEAIEAMRNAKLGKYEELANNWRGGRAKERKVAMSRDEYKTLRKTVFIRDDYTCQLCGVRGGDLEMDHIKEWCNYPELRFVASNCRTLCKDCHKTTDNFGTKAIKRKVGV